MFCARKSDADFAAATARVEDALQDARFSSERMTEVSGVLRLRVTGADGDVVDVDLGCDYRVLAPATLEVGPVLALEDAVGNKVAALFGRGEPRDFLDVDAIRRTGQFTDGQLLELAAARDGGFTVDWFAKRLASITRIAPEWVRDRYQVDVDEFRATQARLVAWAKTLAPRPRDIHASGASSPKMQGRVWTALSSLERSEGQARGAALARLARSASWLSRVHIDGGVAFDREARDSCAPRAHDPRHRAKAAASV